MAMTEAPVPFYGRSVDLTEPTQLVVMVGLFIAGATLYHMTDAVGSTIGNALNSALGGVLGVNPATGSADDGPGVL